MDERVCEVEYKGRSRKERERKIMREREREELSDAFMCYFLLVYLLHA